MELKEFLHRLTEIRFFRFVITGVINTIFGYSIFVVLYLTIRSENISLPIATVIGIIFNYMTTGRYVFKAKGWGHFPRFMTAYVVSFVVNILAMNSIIYFGANPIVAQALSLPLAILVSYIWNARIVFRRI